MNRKTITNAEDRREIAPDATQSAIQSAISRIQHLLEIAGDGIREAAAIYADRCAADPRFPARCRESAPWVSERTWGILESIGNGRADWRVASMVAPHWRVLSRLPVAQQTEVLDHGVEFPHGADTVSLPISVLTSEQARIAFAGGRLRTTAEIANAIRSPVPASASRRTLRGEKWRVVGRTLVVSEACTLSLSEIQAIYLRVSK